MSSLIYSRLVLPTFKPLPWSCARRANAACASRPTRAPSAFPGCSTADTPFASHAWRPCPRHRAASSPWAARSAAALPALAAASACRRHCGWTAGCGSRYQRRRKRRLDRRRRSCWREKMRKRQTPSERLNGQFKGFFLGVFWANKSRTSLLMSFWSSRWRDSSHQATCMSVCLSHLPAVSPATPGEPDSGCLPSLSASAWPSSSSSRRWSCRAVAAAACTYRAKRSNRKKERKKPVVLTCSTLSSKGDEVVATTLHRGDVLTAGDAATHWNFDSRRVQGFSPWGYLWVFFFLFWGFWPGLMVSPQG